MATQDDPAQYKNTYFTDPESATEMARLTLQDRLATKGMGGLFSEQTELDFSKLHDILDLACGPGTWVLDVAHAYPKIEVVGVDISQIMISYAHAQARVQGLNNASFQVMNILEPLDFSDDAFDIINARFILAFMSPDTWPKLLQECMRKLHPGGILRLTEFEWGITNSLATERIGEMVVRAHKLAGNSFSPDGRHVGITPMLGRLLRTAGYEHVRYKVHGGEYSAGTEAHEGMYQNHMVAFQLFRPLLIKMGLTTPEAFDELYQQSMVDFLSDDFCGISFSCTVWGTKPAS